MTDQIFHSDCGRNIVRLDYPEIFIYAKFFKHILLLKEYYFPAILSLYYSVSSKTETFIFTHICRSFGR